MAERVLISLEDIDVTFGGKPLFEGLRVHICERDRICLVGKNGAGKTTLMKLIIGELEQDRGLRFAIPGLSIGYLAQNVEFKQEETVRTYVLSGLPVHEQTEDKHHLADIVMTPLDLAADALMKTLSGGQVRRASLARALIAAPDVLLLDEPTNHLDLAAIEWLEGYINGYSGAVVCVSHDRAFLTAISRKVFWIDRGMVRTCVKGYAEFDAWAEAIIEQEARELQNMQKKFEAEIDWTQGGVSARRKRNQRRMRELQRLREKLKNDKAAYNQRMQRIALEAESTEQTSKKLFEFKEVSKSFSRDGRELPILKNFDFRIFRGDRIGILGKNGSGKSTFLKLLMGELQPDSGHIFRAKHLEVAYFDQNRNDVLPERTVWDTLVPTGGDYVFIGSGEKARAIHVCGYLKSFLFDPRIARDRVSTLSGGMQNRLLLAKLLANPGNLLILDEPTNDLDMDTLDMLQEIIADYDGTLIIVSHDRDFLDRTVTEVLAFEGEGNVQGYIGGYSDYLAAKLAREAPKVSAIAAKKAQGVPQTTKKPAAKMSFKLVHELQALPSMITGLEDEISSLRAELSDADLYTRDPARFDEASARLALASSELEAAEYRWLELEEMSAKE